MINFKNVFKKSDDKNDKSDTSVSNDAVVVNKKTNDDSDEDKKSGSGFFGGMKNKMMVTMLRSQLAKMPLPAEQKKMFEKILDNKPELLFTIATEIQAEMKKGKGQMQAAQVVMMKYKDELKDIVQN